MGRSNNLHDAKAAKDDEFYTKLSDIENELKHYKKFFRGKSVYCCCDDKDSNFWKYFSMNFDKLGLRKLTATYYDPNKTAKEYKLLKCEDKTVELVGELYQNGDFRSPECLGILMGADIVVTNPPFSLLEEAVKLFSDKGKDFIIVGNKNAIVYKDIFPLLRDKKISLGFTSIHEFVRPDGTTQKFGNVGWFTSLPVNKYLETVSLGRHYDPEIHPEFYNYPAINVGKLADIPDDYYESWGIDHEAGPQWEITRRTGNTNWVIPAKDNPLRDMYDSKAEGYKETIRSVLGKCDYCSGIMGVPITIMERNTDEFDIIGVDSKAQSAELGIRPIGKEWCDIYFAQGNTGNFTPNMRNVVLLIDGKAKTSFKRIFIRRKSF